MLIEAKKLADRDFEAALDQTTMYLLGHNRRNSSKIIYCSCTNGDRWVVLDVTRQDQDPTVMDILLSSADPPAKSALKFLGLWHSSLISGSFDAAAEPILAEEQTESPVVQVPLQPLAKPAPDVPTSRRRGGPRRVGPLPSASTPFGVPVPGWTSLTANFETTHRDAPTAIRLPDGEVKGKNWRSVIIESALWLHRTGVLTRENCRVPVGKGYLMSLDKKELRGSVSLGDMGIWLEVHYSAHSIVRHTRRLLQHFDKDPSQVYLKFE